VTRDGDGAGAQPTDDDVELLDPAGDRFDDDEARNWDGQTREEYLTMLQEAPDNGSVQIDDGYWLGMDDAIVEVGVEEATRLRSEMETYLECQWAALGSDESGPTG